MSDRIHNFGSILETARLAGLLSHVVADDYSFDVDIPIIEALQRAAYVEAWVKDNFGANAIEWIADISTDDPFSFRLGSGSWTYHAGSYYFTSLDEAVAFRLRFGSQ